MLNFGYLFDVRLPNQNGNGEREFRLKHFLIERHPLHCHYLLFKNWPHNQSIGSSQPSITMHFFPPIGKYSLCINKAWKMPCIYGFVFSNDIFLCIQYRFILVIYFVECVCKIKHILSVIHYTIHYIICGAMCFQFTHSLCDDWENIYTLSDYHHQIGSMNCYPLFKFWSWNNGVRCMSFYILMALLNHVSHELQMQNMRLYSFAKSTWYIVICVFDFAVVRTLLTKYHPI